MRTRAVEVGSVLIENALEMALAQQDDVIQAFVVFGERHLRRLLGDYLDHYHAWRCHRSLAMDCPAPRQVQGLELGEAVVEIAEAGGLYRHYERRAA